MQHPSPQRPQTAEKHQSVELKPRHLLWLAAWFALKPVFPPLRFQTALGAACLFDKTAVLRYYTLHLKSGSVQKRAYHHILAPNNSGHAPAQFLLYIGLSPAQLQCAFALSSTIHSAYL